MRVGGDWQAEYLNFYQERSFQFFGIIKLIFMDTNVRAVNIDACTMIFLPMLVGWNLPQFNKKVPTRIFRKVTLVG